LRGKSGGWAAALHTQFDSWLVRSGLGFDFYGILEFEG